MLYNWNGLDSIYYAKRGQSRSINQENPHGEKGKGGMAASALGPSRKGSPCLFRVPAGETVTLAEISGSGVLRHIWMTVDDRTEADYYLLRDLVLRIYWDGEDTPSVESPLGDFFCCGFGKSCTINSLPIMVAPLRGFNCFFPMPFRHGARITLENQHPADIPAFFYQVDYTLEEVPDEALYFHAQWRRQRLTEKQKDYVILDQVRGRGHYVGTYLALTTLERYWWGEGEVKFYLDGDRDYPTICGTGTEDYFGGAWSFASHVDGKTVEQTYQTPFMGYPYYSRQEDDVFSQYYNNDTMPERGFYRWHLMDPILFEQDLRVTIQQIGVCHTGMFERQDDVASVAYWYQTEPHTPFQPLMGREGRRPR